MRTVAAVITIVGAVSVTASAQWLKYPTTGVPRTADGKPNLSAPASRAPDGKPDLSGIWDIEHNRPCPPPGCFDMEVGQEFVNIGWSLKGGLPYQSWAAEARKKRSAEDGKDDPVTHCLPGGVVKSHTSAFLRKIVQTPGLILILREAETSFRQIFTDGRPLPAVELQTFDGYSIGRWDGDTLVVDTVGFRDGLWLDRGGSPMTDAARLTERFTRVNYGTHAIEITLDDPKAYTKPWTVTLHHSLVVDTELVGATCLENEKSLAHIVGK